MKDPMFVLTMQPRMLDQEDSDEELDDDLAGGDIDPHSVAPSSRAGTNETEIPDEDRNAKAAAARKQKMHPDEANLQDAIRPRWFIIRKSSRFRERWDYIVMTLAIYNCLWTPLTVSFDWAMRMDD